MLSAFVQAALQPASSGRNLFGAEQGQACLVVIDMVLRGSTGDLGVLAVCLQLALASWVCERQRCCTPQISVSTQIAAEAEQGLAVSLCAPGPRLLQVQCQAGNECQGLRCSTASAEGLRLVCLQCLTDVPGWC